MKPWMEQPDIVEIEKALFRLNEQHVDILEWGTGGSTVYFTEFLKRHNISYTWLSIEYKQEWYNKIHDLLKDNKDIDVKLFVMDKTNPASINRDDYVTYPRTTGKKFDIIIVDGRQRMRCLIEAKFLLKPGGIVFLHDAERQRYHYAFDYYTEHKFTSPEDQPRKLWKGTIN